MHDLNYVSTEIPRIYTAIAEMMSCIIFISYFERRFSNFKTALICAVFSIANALFMIYTANVPLLWWMPCMIGAFYMMYALLYTTLNLSARKVAYICAIAILLSEFAASLEWQIQYFFMKTRGDKIEINLFIFIAVMSLVLAVVRKLFKPILNEEYLRELNIKELVSAGFIVIIAFSLSNLSFVIKDNPFSGQEAVDIGIIRTLVDFGGVAALFAFQLHLNDIRNAREFLAIQNMLRSQYEQYRYYQSSMELVNIKYHDLKHQITGLRAETDEWKRKEWLDRIEAELEENRLVDRTGNQVLDTILGAKIFQARNIRARITCVVNGELLDFMHVTDICTIFGNALDNALESVAMEENPEKRLIHVAVSNQKNFVKIDVSNYCDGKTRVTDGRLPATTKADKKNHGYGLRSIKYSVEKYGGSIHVDTSNSWFNLYVLIPYPDKKM